MFTSLLTFLMAFYAVENFVLRSNLGALLPEKSVSVENQAWIQAHMGAPSLIQPIIRTAEPQADILILTNDAGSRWSGEIGKAEEKNGALILKMRAPFFKQDTSKEKLTLRLKRRPHNPTAFLDKEWQATAVQQGNTLQIKFQEQDPSLLTTLLGEIRGGDPNQDGVFAMDKAKVGLEIIGDALADLEDIDFALYNFDLNFLEEHGLLYASVDDLQQLKCCIKKKQKKAVRDELGLGEDSDDEEEEEEEDDPFLSSNNQQEDDCTKRDLSDENCSLDPDYADFFRMGSGQVKKKKALYFVSNQGYLTMFLKPSQPATDIASVRRTVKSVEQTYATVLEKNHEEFGQYFQFESLRLGGSYVSRLREIQQLNTDLARSTGLTLIVLFLIIMAYFRQRRAVLYVMLPLSYGVVCSLGLTFMVIGHLNLITAFIFAVLLGLGIDFGIHILNRYVEERTKEQSHEEALFRALGSTGFATTMGALTTTGSFLALTMADFRGFSDFGFIAGVGVPLCLFFVYTLLPALTVLMERYWPVDWTHRKAPKLKSGIISLLLRPPIPTIIPILGITVSILACFGLRSLDFNMDTRAIRSINPENEAIMRQKSGSTEGLPLSPAVVLAENEDHGDRIYDVLRKAYEDQERFESIEQVIGLQALIPREQPEKLKLIGELRGLLRKKRNFVSGAEEQRKLNILYEHTDIDAITREDVPETYVRLFREQHHPITYNVKPWEPQSVPSGLLDWIQESEDRVSGTVFYIFPRKNMWNLWNALEYSEQLRSLKVYDEPLLISSGHIVFADLIQLVKSDGIWASTIAFYAVFVLVLLSFAYLAGRRRLLRWIFLASVPAPLFAFLTKEQLLFAGTPFTTIFILCALLALLVMLLLDRKSVWQALIVTSPLIMSFLMLLALMPIMGWTVNFFNMLFFPAMLGIGIDSSIHVYHRYLEEGDDALESIVSHTGAGIGIASFTTAFGFGGMVLASHLGLQSLGILAVTGLGITFINSVLIFPCLLRILHHQGWLPVQPYVRQTQDQT